MRLQQDIGWSCSYLRARLGLDGLHDCTENLSFFCWLLAGKEGLSFSTCEPLLKAL